MMMKFSISFIAVAQSVGLAVHACNGVLYLKGPMKILVKRSSIYRKFSVSLMSLGREKDWKIYLWILLLIGREGNCVTEFCEACKHCKRKKEGRRQNFRCLLITFYIIHSVVF
jgi:hypothetical protein